MRLTLALCALGWACLASLHVVAAPTAREGAVSVDGAKLYTREIGTGPTIVVLHGGPDFDHLYFLPALDRLADGYRLIYYDQRGRGRSTAGVRAEDVTLASDLADIDAVRKHFKIDSMVLMGHSWGTVLALEYALKHPQRISKLILMNPAPSSSAELGQFREVYIRKLGPDMERQREIVASAAYKSGDPETNTARYRLHFKPAFVEPWAYEQLMAGMKGAFIAQGKEGIVLARAVEDRLMLDTWARPDYDLLPKLKALDKQALVITAEHDFIPVSVAEHVAQALPKAKLVTLRDCGHFAFLECPVEVRAPIDAFMKGTTP